MVTCIVQRAAGLGSTACVCWCPGPPRTPTSGKNDNMTHPSISGVL